MRISEIFKRASAALERKKMVSAIILASGTGDRFRIGTGDRLETIKKQFISVGGIPAIVRCAAEFEKCALVDEIIVVTGEEDIEYCRRLLEGNIKKLTHVTAGGETRQKSAMAGLDLVDESSDFVAVHDGARCLVTADIIESVLREAFANGAAAAAERAVDTIKEADCDGMIINTIDRDTAWLMKTPQAFMADMYRAGVYSAEKDGVTVTDDCMLVERLGFKVKAVDCGRENIKLTYPEDRIIAEAILRYRDIMKRGEIEEDNV